MTPSSPIAHPSGLSAAEMRVRQALAADHDVAEQPDDRTGRRCRPHGAPQDEQRPVDQRRVENPQHPRPSIGRQFQRERRRLALQDRARQHPRHHQREHHAEQDDGRRPSPPRRARRIAGGNAAATKTVASMISVGKRPLQGTKLFVRIATSRSRGESMTRVAITPAALQPKPIAMVSACLPCAPAFLKRKSRLNATRGR